MNQVPLYRSLTKIWRGHHLCAVLVFCRYRSQTFVCSMQNLLLHEQLGLLSEYALIPGVCTALQLIHLQVPMHLLCVHDFCYA